MSHEYPDSGWEYEVDTVQRGGVTKRTKVRRHGRVHRPDVSDEADESEKRERKERGFDRDGIPTGI